MKIEELYTRIKEVIVGDMENYGSLMIEITRDFSGKNTITFKSFIDPDQPQVEVYYNIAELSLVNGKIFFAVTPLAIADARVVRAIVAIITEAYQL